ncbi:MAG: hypothetical protein HRU34_20810 [Richelia sp.]|nr:hypothetical protein [Richelia sp.]CDN11919.1 hypothetical protein RintRC_6164 [Richelia intracellularis]
MGVKLKDAQIPQDRAITERLNQANALLGAEDVASKTGVIYVLERGFC